MTGKVEPLHQAVTAGHAITDLDGALAELATEQAGMAQSLQLLTNCVAVSLDGIPEPALLLAEETLAYARASVLIATYLVRMIDGHRRRSDLPPGERSGLEQLPPIGGSSAYRADAATAG
jgi:hypothetical protein